MMTFRCTVDDIDQIVDAVDKDDAMLILMANMIVTEEQAERMDIEQV